MTSSRQLEEAYKLFEKKVKERVHGTITFILSAPRILNGYPAIMMKRSNPDDSIFIHSYADGALDMIGWKELHRPTLFVDTPIGGNHLFLF